MYGISIRLEKIKWQIKSEPIVFRWDNDHNEHVMNIDEGWEPFAIDNGHILMRRQKPEEFF